MCVNRYRRPWRLRRVVLFAVGIVVCAALGMFFLQEGREQSDQWASVLGVFLNLGALLLTIDTTLGLRGGVTTGRERSDAEYLENLATAVARAYSAETAIRQLQDPDLFPIDWRLADRDLMDHPGNVWPGADGQPTGIRYTSSILDAHLQVPTGRLVVLGDPGSGKTVAALTFAADLLTVRRPGERVPVVLSASTWSPDSQDFRSWLSDGLVDLDSRLADLDRDGVSWARRLVNGRGVLPVLDGLDELPVRVKGSVLQALNAVLDRDEHIVLTCRTEQYRTAVEASDVLTGAAVVQLQPLHPDALAAYLPRTTRPDRDPASGTKWAPLLRQLRDQSDLPSSRSVAAVLSSPLMVWLARVQFSDTNADPSQLLQPEFHDPQMLRQHLLDGLIAAVYADPGRHHPNQLPATKAEKWLKHLAARLVSDGDQTLRWWRLADGMPLRDLRVVLAAVATIAAAIAATIVLSVNAGTVRGAFFGCLFGVIVGVAVWLIPWLRRRPEPATVRSASLTLGIRHVGGILVVGIIPVGGAAIVNMTSVNLTLETAASVIALFMTMVVGLLGVPVEADQAVGPLRLLKADRTSAITQGCLIGFASGLLATTAAWTALPTAAALAIGAILAVLSGTAWALVGTAWGRLVLMRLYWSLTQELPPRLMTFLADAHNRGILRQVGATYQFRHELLLAHLAAHS